MMKTTLFRTILLAGLLFADASDLEGPLDDIEAPDLNNGIATNTYEERHDEKEESDVEPPIRVISDPEAKLGPGEKLFGKFMTAIDEEGYAGMEDIPKEGSDDYLNALWHPKFRPIILYMGDKENDHNGFLNKEKIAELLKLAKSKSDTLEECMKEYLPKIMGILQTEECVGPDHIKQDIQG